MNFYVTFAGSTSTQELSPQPAFCLAMAELNETANSELQNRSKVVELVGTNSTRWGPKLEEYWTATGDNRLSLRELACVFNETLVAEALNQDANSTLNSETANHYRLLTSDDVSSGMRL